MGIGRWQEIDRRLSAGQATSENTVDWLTRWRFDTNGPGKKIALLVSMDRPDDDTIAGLDRESKEAIDSARAFLSGLKIVAEIESELVKDCKTGIGKKLSPNE